MRDAPSAVQNAFQPDSVQRVLGREPARVLMIGPGHNQLASAWTARGYLLHGIVNATDLESAPGPWDAVLIAGSLESERWDRWFIQRLHRVLAPGGVLVLAVPNLFDIWTRAGLQYLWSRVLRQVRRRLARRSAIPIADRSVFQTRRYARLPLLDMVAGVGFEVVSCEAEGHGLGRFSAVLGTGAGRTGRRLVLTARRLSSVWGEGRPFPSCDSVMLSFRPRHASDLAAREEWRLRSGAPGTMCEVPVHQWARAGAAVFAPHPDDEVIGCGGTLLDLVAQGAAVTIVQVTDGSDSAAFIMESEQERRQVRLAESRIVAQRLGAELVCLEADNRNLQATPQLQSRFREVLERTGAGIAFAPSFTDIHPDHQTVLRLLAGAISTMTGRRPDVALYEVWSLVPPTHVRDVGGSIGEIEQLLLAYETALKVDDYVHLVAERLLFNSCEHRGHPGYLECFHVLPPDRFLSLAAEHFAVRGD